MLYPNFQELVELKAKISSNKINSNKLIRSLISGSYFSPFRGQGLEFEEVRQYVAGDDIRKIDWQVTARSGRPHIKLFREERERNVLICLDLNRSMRFGTRSTFKSIQAANITALLGWCALANSNMVGGCLFGDIDGGKKFFKPSRRQNSFLRILQQICGTPVTNHGQSKRCNLVDSIDYIRKVSQAGSLVFIISDFLAMNDKIVDSMADLNMKSQLVLISVNDPADFHLTDCGNITLSNGEDEININTSNATFREKYNKMAMENIEKLKDISTSNNIVHIPLMTSSDIYFELFYEMKDKMSTRSRRH